MDFSEPDFFSVKIVINKSYILCSIQIKHYNLQHRVRKKWQCILGPKCPLVGTSVHKSFFSDFNEIWYIYRRPWVMHGGVPYDPIQGQGQGHGASEVPKIALF